jgi:hypothetical protein
MNQTVRPGPIPERSLPACEAQPCAADLSEETRVSVEERVSGAERSGRIWRASGFVLAPERRYARPAHRIVHVLGRQRLRLPASWRSAASRATSASSSALQSVTGSKPAGVHQKTSDHQGGCARTANRACRRRLGRRAFAGPLEGGVGEASRGRGRAHRRWQVPRHRRRCRRASGGQSTEGCSSAARDR